MSRSFEDYKQASTRINDVRGLRGIIEQMATEGIRVRKSHGKLQNLLTKLQKLRAKELFLAR